MAIYRVCTACRTVWQVGTMKSPPRRYVCPECERKRVPHKMGKDAKENLGKERGA